MLFKSASLVVQALLCVPTLALLEEPFVTFGSQPGAIAIHNAPILYSLDDYAGVRIAAESLVNDLLQITGAKPSLIAVKDGTSPAGNSTDTAIIVGSVNSTLIQHLGGNTTNSTSNFAHLQGKWESFSTKILNSPLPGIQNALVIAGSDKRGTVFGIHTLAEQCGQSPFHWFADVPAKKHSEIYALDIATTHGEPSVKYRGLFINDEEPATTLWWARRHNASHYPLDTEYYRHVFDMMLRLKANYIWPAMWRSYTPPPGQIFFTDDPGNIQLANDYGIVVSTSHHEPMQRATNEWNATETGPWDWRNNKANVTKFMEEGVRRAGNNESYFTMGMRGPNDGPIVGDDALDILNDVFETERSIFKEVYGSETAVNQVWTLYKEVQTYYAAGLVPPDDVTLMFSDDNAGNMQRLPTGNETSRSGGLGAYFHFEYVGSPTSYKWQNHNNLAKVYKELSQAKMRGADRIWIMNVGDIKPMELPFSFSMDLAWNASSVDFDTIPLYLDKWVGREFGAEYSEVLTPLLLEWMHLIGARRYEAVSPATFSRLYYGEADRVLTRWEVLHEGVSALQEKIPEELKPAYYQLIYYPIVSGATYYYVQLGVGRNRQYALEKRNSANGIADQVRAAFESDYDLTEGFDNLLGGKWRGIMSQSKYDDLDGTEPYGTFRDWAQTSRDMLANLSYVQLRQDMQYTLGNMGIYAEQSVNAAIQGRWTESIDASLPSKQYGNPEREWTPTLPVMDPYGPPSRKVELFMRGDYRVPINWTLGEIPFNWIRITPRSGVLNHQQYDQTLNISIDWNQVPNGYNSTVAIPITASPSHYPYLDHIYIPIQNQRVPAGFTGFPETEGSMISIEAPHYQGTQPAAGSDSNSTAQTVNFVKIPHLGSRTESGSLALRPFDLARTTDSTTAAATYNIYLFNASTALNATVYINSCLDTDPNLPLKFSLTLDDQPANFTRVLGSPKNAGDLPPEWMGSVMDNVWTRKVALGAAAEGAHKLVWRTNNPEVYLEKIVLWTRGREGARLTYLGPPETRLVQGRGEES
ncbi:glycoside hydrolase family 115 protein [Aaosphaeria arxii CBS 175.79]|uniref:Glycoside hydrolase family 115 protein n=1 Tax=Aaosphaeria arxii CBS 175.79 TaxID=1450172 RepID=A0A6A5Y147_9PLEO|nr:glycoside hydrolase family 115 protein [Aaosphaeria arxii CBS 175.79]KAF2018797.1 glycoside hydrolase family 115 protein [Aaosphaeria arxii CBS 175.79]